MILLRGILQNIDDAMFILDLRVRCLEKAKHILPNDALIVIYHVTQYTFPIIQEKEMNHFLTPWISDGKLVVNFKEGSHWILMLHFFGGTKG